MLIAAANLIPRYVSLFYISSVCQSLHTQQVLKAGTCFNQKYIRRKFYVKQLKLLYVYFLGK